MSYGAFTDKKHEPTEAEIQAVSARSYRPGKNSSDSSARTTRLMKISGSCTANSTAGR